jgi:hypothetical protein
VTIHWSKITEQKYHFLVASMWGNDPFGQMRHVPEKRKKFWGVGRMTFCQTKHQ